MQVLTHRSPTRGLLADALLFAASQLGCAGGSSSDEDGSSSTSGAAEMTNAETLDPTGDDHPTTNTDTSADTATSSMTSGETETTDPTGSTGPTGCQNSSECTNPAEPVCLDSECALCTDTPDGDTACMSKDANFPVCAEDGQCVQCNAANDAACDGTTPICDTGASSCVACTYHEQCEGTACNIDTGACFDDSCIVHVDGNGGQDTTTIGAAIADGCIVIVHEQDGFAPYTQPVVIGGDTVAIFAAPGEEPLWEGTGGNPTLSVNLGGNVYLQDMELSGNSGAGVSVDGAGIWLDRAEVVQNTGGGLVLTNGATAQVRTSMIGGPPDLSAFDSTDSEAMLLYSTIAGGTGDATALQCSGGDVTVRNSIVVSRGGEEFDILCDADMSDSVTENPYGAGNVSIGNLTSGNQDVWFDAYGTGNFGLNTPPAPVLTAARWRTADLAAVPPRPANDPATDINGQDRPDQDDAEDVAGADIP